MHKGGQYSSPGIGYEHCFWLPNTLKKYVLFEISRGSPYRWLTGWPDENAVFQFFPVSNYAGKEYEKQKRCRNPQKIKRTSFSYHNFSQFDSSIILFLSRSWLNIQKFKDWISLRKQISLYYWQVDTWKEWECESKTNYMSSWHCWRIGEIGHPIIILLYISPCNTK